MSWRLIARKDFEDVVRSGMFWSIIGVTLLLFVIAAFGIATEEGATQYIMYQIFNNLGSQMIIPVTALIFGYMAIAGERESGSLRILFGLSHSRRDVLVGKLLSRSAVMTVAILVMSMMAGGLILVLFDAFEAGTFLGFALLTVVYTISFVGIAIGISSMTGSRARAMAGAVGSFVAFTLIWYPLAAILHYVVEGELAGVQAPDWYLGLVMLNPKQAYTEVLGVLLDQHVDTMITWPAIVEDVPEKALAEGDTALLLSNRAGDAPFYLSDWFALLVLVAWFVVPVVVGYRQFQNADLN